MGYLKEMKTVVETRLNKVPNFNKYVFVEDKGAFWVDVPLTLSGFSFEIIIVLSEEMSVKVIGNITDTIPDEFKQDIDILAYLFNEKISNGEYEFIFDDPNVFYCDDWRSSIYTVDDEDYDAKEDLEDLTKTIALTPVATLTQFCYAMDLIINHGMDVVGALMKATQE